MIHFQKTNTVIPVTPTEVQEKYLGLIREFFDKGMQVYSITWGIIIFMPFFLEQPSVA